MPSYKEEDRLMDSVEQEAMIRKKKINLNSEVSEDEDVDQNELLNALKLCAFKLDYD